MAGPIEQVVEQGLLLGHEGIELVDKDYSHALGPLLQIFVLGLAALRRVSVQSVPQNFDFVLFLEELVQEEGCGGWGHFFARDFLVNDCVDQVGVRQLHCVDCLEGELVLCLQVADHFHRCRSFARSRHP